MKKFVALVMALALVAWIQNIPHYYIATIL